MNPDDTITVGNVSYQLDYDNVDSASISWSGINLDVDDDDYKIDFNISDASYDIVSTGTNAEIYTSYQQREQHDKYPALQKAWDDYIAMYNLTKGEPPIVD
jgi:hypothetical protein